MSAELMSAWLSAKEQERQAIEERRLIEDELFSSLGFDPNQDGTQTQERDGYKVKVINRFSRKVDSDALQEIAAEHGITHHLGDLFRWKPDINAAAWKAADPSITEPLLSAITTSPGRPSFTIEKEQ